MTRKAKAYAAELLPLVRAGDEEGTLVKLKEIINSMLKIEVPQIFEARHGCTEAALAAILVEQIQKFKAIARIVNDELKATYINPDYLRIYLESSPELNALLHDPLLA